MVVKKLGVALALLALMEPAAAGVKFADEDVESEEALWRLYERWLAHFNVSRHPAEKVRRFSLFKEAARQIHRRAAVRGHAPGLNRFVDLSTLEFDSDYGCNDKPDEPADARLPVTSARRDGYRATRGTCTSSVTPGTATAPATFSSREDPTPRLGWPDKFVCFTFSCRIFSSQSVATIFSILM